jgi:hypothetical protein
MPKFRRISLSPSSENCNGAWLIMQIESRPMRLTRKRETVDESLTETSRIDMEYKSDVSETVSISSIINWYFLINDGDPLDLHKSQFTLDLHKSQFTLDLHKSQFTLDLHKSQFTLDLHKSQFTLDIHKSQFTLDLHKSQFTLDLHKSQFTLHSFAQIWRTFSYFTKVRIMEVRLHITA